MKAWKEITHYAGFDWAHDHHNVVIVDRLGQIVADFAIKHSATGWQRWREQVAALAACRRTHKTIWWIPFTKEPILALLPYRQHKVCLTVRTKR